MNTPTSRPIKFALRLTALLLFAAMVCLMTAKRGYAHGDTPHPEVSSSDIFTTTPSLYGWLVNVYGLQGHYTLANGSSGSNLAHVQQIKHDSDFVYVYASGIPSYSIGPFNDGNPGVPDERNYRFRIPKNPSSNNSAKTATPLAQIGVLVNGVPIYNALDDFSWSTLLQRDGQGMVGGHVWNRNAVWAEAVGFDACLGHPAMSSYHHHQQPICLRQQFGDDGSHHSPLLGWSFDGYPIYGPYGYASALDASSPITRMLSSYRLRNITARTTLPDGTTLSALQYGPAISADYPLGRYVEDYEYVAGLGSLDAYNGRFAITPEFPNGTYAYFITINADGSSAYPYAIGPSYYGTPDSANFGPNNVTVPSTAITLAPIQTYLPTLLRFTQ